jgi:hypothetical protein
MSAGGSLQQLDLGSGEWLLSVRLHRVRTFGGVG